ncbi:Beta-lactamase domain protein [Hyphomicrobium sp. MC1]|nr:Beta-lactamase domain protein [Hyphomicrobium sp. MC1]
MQNSRGRIDRRALLAGTSAGTLSLLMPRANAFSADSPTITPPALDALEIRVVTDGLSYALAKSGKEGDVEVIRPGHFLSENAPPHKALIGEFGLSLYAESRQREQVQRVLVDFGYTSDALNNNLDLLGIDVAQIDALVLSHGHYDHFGGLDGFLEKNKNVLKFDIPLYLGDAEVFCARRYVRNGKNYGVIDRVALSASPVRAVSSDAPTLIANHALSTGQIPQSGFEKVLSPTQFEVGLDSARNGCPAGQLPASLRGDGAHPDDFHHEIATAYHVRDKGLVVLTSCGHRGVLNSIRQAQKISGIKQVHAVIGGFHLAPHNAAYVEETLDGLLNLDVAHIIPLHCSGEAFYERARARAPERLIRAYVGTTLKFTA